MCGKVCELKYGIKSKPINVKLAERLNLLPQSFALRVSDSFVTATD